ncbi:hypothetical protein F4679DRAFT_556459 [Xylaria curta]|nr:hypothetical protein F4679DRAFT_556459 [Xylaria curta]
MENVPADLLPQSDRDKHLDVAYKDRWECLKQVIVRLYLGNYGQEGKATTLKQVANFMKANYSFHAAETEYRSHFRSWKIGKRVVNDIKNDAAFALAKRKQPGTSTSQITFVEGEHNKQLHPNKLVRHLKEQRRHRPIETITPGLLSSWNLPYEAFIASIKKDADKPSPFGPLGTTPEHINIKSPLPLTPGREAAGPSPNMELVYQKARENRALLFVQGRLEELLISLHKEDRKLLVDCFHDFYIHGFTMAREWFKQSTSLQSSVSPSPHTQHMDTMGSPMTSSFWINAPGPSTSVGSSSRIQVSNPPTRLCNWSIHVPPPSGDAECRSFIDPPGTRPPSTSFVNELRQSMACGSFSNTPVGNLPIAHDDIVHAITNDPKALEIDAWKLAIMAGNFELIEDMFRQNRIVPDGIHQIYPFHLAASFLDGGHTCCKVFEQLVSGLGPTYAFHRNIDNLGHTILDALMVSILRSHTAICPDSVNSAFHSPNRFPGEETDICGRWTADTSRLRELFRQGFCRIPTTWKHPFCHTAVQAVCHCIVAVYGPACAPSVNTMSGLFIRRCTECGLELKLGPLHSLVVTAFYLANLGMSGETLFGPLAMLVCLISIGADASLTANISVDEILNASEAGGCSHNKLSPLELMKKVPENIINGWNSDCKVGWHCFARILSRAERQSESRHESALNNDVTDRLEEVSDSNSELESDISSNQNDCELKERDGSHLSWMNLNCSDARIGLLWATIQTEFLTYRRLKDGDPWLSEKFSMMALEDWLLGHSATFQTPLVTDNLMRRHSRCGWFLYYRGTPVVHPAAQEVCANYFMNMDIYDRAAFIDKTELEMSWMDEWDSRSHTDY